MFERVKHWDTDHGWDGFARIYFKLQIPNSKCQDPNKLKIKFSKYKSVAIRARRACYPCAIGWNTDDPDGTG